MELRKLKAITLHMAIALVMIVSNEAIALDTPPIDGYFQVDRYVFGTNYPSYLDNQGTPIKYGIDLQVNFRVVPKWFTVSLGVDAVAQKVFTQAAGRAGITGHLWNFDITLSHRSPHSFDHKNELPGGEGFYQANWLGIRYNFGRAN